jgi:hypothetical protein
MDWGKAGAIFTCRLVNCRALLVYVFFCLQPRYHSLER